MSRTGADSEKLKGTGGVPMTLFSALILLAAGAYNLYYALRKRRSCSAPATARVVEIRNRVPILEYSVSGKPTQSGAGIVKRYKVGDQVDILYNPEKPAECRIAGKNGVLILSVVLLVLGMAGLATEFLV